MRSLKISYLLQSNFDETLIELPFPRMVFTVESKIGASRTRVDASGGIRFEFERVHQLIDDLRKSQKYSWLVTLLEHFTLNPERLYDLLDVLDIGSRLEDAANLLERYGVEKRVDADGWTRLERDFIFRLPGLPQNVNKWHFSFNREIRAFRLSTTIEREEQAPLDFRIECCLGKRSIGADGITIMEREQGASVFKPARLANNHRLAGTAAREVLHTARTEYGE